MATRTALEEALAFFDGAEKKVGPQIPDDFFPASVYAAEKGIATNNMKTRLDRLVRLGEMECIVGNYGPKRAVTKFYGPKR
jgi:hypothetical protein